MNNFQRLEEEEMDNLPQLPLGIGHQVHNSLDNMRTMGSMVDLYLTKIVDVFVMMAGGKSERPNNGFSPGGSHGTPTDPHSDGPGGPAKR